MKDNLGASQATGLAGAEAPEPPSRLGPAGGIPCAARLRRGFDEWTLDPTYDLRHEAADLLGELYWALEIARHELFIRGFGDSRITDALAKARGEA